MVFFENKIFSNETNQIFIPGFPMQIFENIDGSVKSSLFLIDKSYLKSEKKYFKDLLVEKFSITVNFNSFKHNKNKRASQKVEMDTFFENHIRFIDDIQTMNDRALSKYKNYEFTIDFSKEEEINDVIDSARNKKTIARFNTFYNQNNDFRFDYASTSQEGINPYRILFKNRYWFPDFNLRRNFLLIINKRKNNSFKKSISFFKFWSYQCLTYETKEKIIYYGFLPPNFNYNSEIIYIKEVLDSLHSNYEFIILNKDAYQSTLSIYILPPSSQYLEKINAWDLDKTNAAMTIQEKEDLVTNHIKSEQ